MENNNRRQLLTIAIVGAVSIGAYYYFTSSSDGDRAERPAQQAAQPGGRVVGKAPAKNARPAINEAERERQRVRQERRGRIETKRFTVELSNLNTGVRHVRLKGERYVRNGRPIDVVTTDKEKYLAFRVEVGGVAIPEDAIWEME